MIMLIDFMISFIHVSNNSSELPEWVAMLEEGQGRLEKRFPAEDFIPELSIGSSNFPHDPEKADGLLAGELIGALNMSLSH